TYQSQTLASPDWDSSVDSREYRDCALRDCPGRNGRCGSRGAKLFPSRRRWRHGSLWLLRSARVHADASPEDKEVAIVRAYMAHHEGMTLVAINDAPRDGAMRARFHAEPIIQATELLLQERTPRDVLVAHPRAEEVTTAAN